MYDLSANYLLFKLFTSSQYHFDAIFQWLISHFWVCTIVAGICILSYVCMYVQHLQELEQALDLFCACLKSSSHYLVLLYIQKKFKNLMCVCLTINNQKPCFIFSWPKDCFVEEESEMFGIFVFQLIQYIPELFRHIW